MAKRSAAGFESRLRTRIHIKDATQKLHALILHISQQLADDPSFGATKLNKTLWRIDFTAFAARGTPITGLSYQKLEKGPVLRSMPHVIREMQEQDKIGYLDLPALGGKKTRKVVIPRKTISLDDLFTDEEQAIIAFCINLERGKTATQSSRDSHVPAVEMTELKHDIPYELALISERRPSRAAFEHAKKLAVALAKRN